LPCARQFIIAEQRRQIGVGADRQFDIRIGRLGETGPVYLGEIEVSSGTAHDSHFVPFHAPAEG
jgi:hypothetical protein